MLYYQQFIYYNSALTGLRQQFYIQGRRKRDFKAKIKHVVLRTPGSNCGSLMYQT